MARGTSLDPRQRSARTEQVIDAPRYFGVGFQRGGVVRLEPRVDDERASAAPVLVFDQGSEAVDVYCWVGASERYPEEVGESSGRKVGVVNEDDERELRKNISR